MNDQVAVGLLLAAGAGTRMGLPKALVQDPSTGQFWLNRSVRALHDGGCEEVTVVLGADADGAVGILEQTGDVVHTVIADDWAEGMGNSLLAGLRSFNASKVDAAVVMLVDLPDVGGVVVRNVLDTVDLGPGCLARASYQGVPGHPVVLGRSHWAKILDSAGGDRGARNYLAASGVQIVECGHLASGYDQDTPIWGWTRSPFR